MGCMHCLNSTDVEGIAPRVGFNRASPEKVNDLGDREHEDVEDLLCHGHISNREMTCSAMQ